MTTSPHDSTGSAARAADPAIVAMRPEHGPQVLAIYQAGMDTGNATFETAAPGWTDFDQRHLPEHRVVALAPGGQVAGWVAAAPVSGRCVYAGVIEHSVYVDSGHAGQGIGAALLQALIQSADAAGVWTIQTGIFPRTTPAWRCTGAPGSAPSAPANASANATAVGGTWFASNADADYRRPGLTRRPRLRNRRPVSFYVPSGARVIDTITDERRNCSVSKGLAGSSNQTSD